MTTAGLLKSVPVMIRLHAAKCREKAPHGCQAVKSSCEEMAHRAVHFVVFLDAQQVCQTLYASAIIEGAHRSGLNIEPER